MTAYISALRNLKFFANIAVVSCGLQFASCQLCRFFWLIAGKAAALLLSGAFLDAWHSAPPQIFLGCPFEALAFLHSVLQALVGAL